MNRKAKCLVCGRVNTIDTRSDAEISRSDVTLEDEMRVSSFGCDGCMDITKHELIKD